MTNEEILQALENDIKLRGLSQNTLEHYVDGDVVALRVNHRVFGCIGNAIVAAFLFKAVIEA